MHTLKLLIRFVLLTAFISINSIAQAGKISLDKLVLELNDLATQNTGIVIWDQREMVTDGSQPESFMGYLRSITGISYGQVTKTRDPLTEVLAAKVKQAYAAKGAEIGVIKVGIHENESDLLNKIKAAAFEKVIVLKLNNFIFDGVAKVEYVEDIEVSIYTQNGQTVYTNHINTKTRLGSAGRVKKTVPAHIKSTFEGIFNNAALHNALQQKTAPKDQTAALDIIITKKGDEMEAKVVEITTTTIKYKAKDQLDGPIRNIAIADVFMIKYSNGTKEVFE
tara:strand:- start:1360 stop:2196 length:837 start_codon:yes stop_codon:yes gene_type:complete